MGAAPARRASWVARGLGSRARAASSCLWSTTRGSGAVTGIVCLGSGLIPVRSGSCGRCVAFGFRGVRRVGVRGAGSSGCCRRRLGVVGGIVGVGRGSGRNGWRGFGGSVPAVPAVPPGRLRGRPAPRHANRTVGLDPIPPSPCQVPPRTPKKPWFRSCVSLESTSVAVGVVATSHNPLFRSDCSPRDVARRARTRRFLTRGGCIRRACRR